VQLVDPAHHFPPAGTRDNDRTLRWRRHVRCVHLLMVAPSAKGMNV
jgi:hypothetical protein